MRARSRHSAQQKYHTQRHMRNSYMRISSIDYLHQYYIIYLNISRAARLRTCAQQLARHTRETDEYIMNIISSSTFITYHSTVHHHNINTRLLLKRPARASSSAISYQYHHSCEVARYGGARARIDIIISSIYRWREQYDIINTTSYKEIYTVRYASRRISIFIRHLRT